MSVMLADDWCREDEHEEKPRKVCPACLEVLPAHWEKCTFGDQWDRDYPPDIIEVMTRP